MTQKETFPLPSAPKDERVSPPTRRFPVAHYIRLTTSNSYVTETRIVPGIRGGDRAINLARQLAVAWGLENGSKVVTFSVEDAEGKPVGEGTVVVPPAG